MKSNPIFKKKVPLEYFYAFLDNICPNSKEYYLIDKDVYRRMLQNQLHKDFINILMDFYHISKIYYLTREFTYNSFGTVIRQICNLHQIQFLANKKYNHSEYTIRYIVNKSQ